MATVVSVVFIALLLAAQANAEIPVVGALKSATTAATQPAVATGGSAASVTAPASETAAKDVAKVLAPANETAAREPSKAGVSSVENATQSAGKVVVPVVKTVTHSAASVVPTSTSVTPSVRSVARTVVNVANPVTTAAQRLAPTAPTAESLSRVATRVVAHVGDKPALISLPRIGSGSAPNAPGAAAHGGAFSGAGAVPVGSGASAAPRCGLAGYEEGLARSCGTSAPRPPRFVAGLPSGESPAATASLDGLAAGSASTAAHGGSPPDGVRGSPAPSPPPGGVSPSTAAASGLACSMLLTLAAVLFLWAPRAMRRLRLCREQWPLAPFVLMPERPG